MGFDLLLRYDDGDHEWMILRDEQDRVMIWKETVEQNEEDQMQKKEEDGEEDELALGHWLEFKYCRLAEKQTNMVNKIGLHRIPCKYIIYFFIV